MTLVVLDPGVNVGNLDLAAGSEIISHPQGSTIQGYVIMRTPATITIPTGTLLRINAGISPATSYHTGLELWHNSLAQTGLVTIGPGAIQVDMGSRAETFGTTIGVGTTAAVTGTISMLAVKGVHGITDNQNHHCYAQWIDGFVIDEFVGQNVTDGWSIHMWNGGAQLLTDGFIVKKAYFEDCKACFTFGTNDVVNCQIQNFHAVRCGYSAVSNMNARLGEQLNDVALGNDVGIYSHEDTVSGSDPLFNRESRITPTEGDPQLPLELMNILGLIPATYVGANLTTMSSVLKRRYITRRY